jgi:alkaline phosphatase
VLVTSDHGNVEDLSTRTHTLAPVPVLAFGPAAARVGGVRDLTHVAPLVAELARGEGALHDSSRFSITS